MEMKEFIDNIEKIHFLEDDCFDDQEEKQFIFRESDDLFININTEENTFSIYKEFWYSEENVLGWHIESKKRDIFYGKAVEKYKEKIEAKLVDWYCPFGETEVGFWDLPFNINDVNEFLVLYQDYRKEENEIAINDIYLECIFEELPNTYTTKRIKDFAINMEGTHGISIREKIIEHFGNKIEKIKKVYFGIDNILFKTDTIVNAIPIKDFEIFKNVEKALNKRR